MAGRGTVVGVALGVWNVEDSWVLGNLFDEFLVFSLPRKALAT